MSVENITNTLEKSVKPIKKIINIIDNLPQDKKDKIIFLRDENVIKWLYGDTTFLEPENKIIGYKKKKIDKDNGKIYKSGKKKGETKYDKVEINFHKKVSLGYKKISHKNKRFVIINAAQKKQIIHKAIIEKLGI